MRVMIDGVSIAAQGRGPEGSEPNATQKQYPRSGGGGGGLGGGPGSDFTRRAAGIGLGIHATSGKVKREGRVP